MKKAVIATGGKQYLVSVGDVVQVEVLEEKKSHTFEPLAVIDGKESKIGAPTLSDVKVTAEVVNQEVKMEKITAIRYEAKKRVRKIRGHRQRQTEIKITAIK